MAMNGLKWPQMAIERASKGEFHADDAKKKAHRKAKRLGFGQASQLEGAVEGVLLLHRAPCYMDSTWPQAQAIAPTEDPAVKS